MLGDFTTRRNAWYFQAHHHEIDRILISAMQTCNMAYFKLIYCTFWCNDYENNVNEGVEITLLTHSLFHMHAPLNSHGSQIPLWHSPFSQSLSLSLSEFIIVSLSWTLLKYFSSSFPPPFLLLSSTGLQSPLSFENLLSCFSFTLRN